MNVANIGAFSQGLMRGHMAATEEQRKEQEEKRRQEDQKFADEQRGVWRKDQARKDRVEAGIARVNDPEEVTGFEIDPEATLNSGEVMTKQVTLQRPVSEATRIKRLQDLYMREGMPDQAFAMVDRGNAAEDRVFTLGQRDRTLRQQTAVDAVLAKRKSLLEELDKDPDAFAMKHGDMFNRDEFGGPRHAGARLAFASTPQGKVAYYIGQDGSTMGDPIPINRQSLTGIINQLTDEELGVASPEMYAANRTYGLQREQAATQRISANAAVRSADAAITNANTNAGYRDWLATRPIVQTDGRGRIVALSPDATRRIGTYGDARPDPSANAGVMRPTVRSMTVMVPDPVTGKASRLPVNVTTTMGDNGIPVTRAFTLDGKPITDNKVLSQLVAGEQAQSDPQLATFDAMRSSIVNNKDMDVQTKLAELGKIDGLRSMHLLGQQVSGLSKEERVPELRKLIQQKVPADALAQLGFSREEIREASRPSGTATNPAQGATQGATQGLPGRLSDAIKADNAAGNNNRYYFKQLADEVAPQAEVLRNQIKVLQQAINQMGPANSGPAQRKLQEHQRDLMLMESILAQRKAQLGY